MHGRLEGRDAGGSIFSGSHLVWRMALERSVGMAGGHCLVGSIIICHDCDDSWVRREASCEIAISKLLPDTTMTPKMLMVWKLKSGVATVGCRSGEQRTLKHSREQFSN